MTQKEFLNFEKQVRKFDPKSGGMRRGQFAFNLLYEKDPTLASRLQGTNFDPYYSDVVLEEFLGAIYEVL